MLLINTSDDRNRKISIYNFIVLVNNLLQPYYSKGYIHHNLLMYIAWAPTIKSIEFSDNPNHEIKIYFGENKKEDYTTGIIPELAKDLKDYVNEIYIEEN